MATFSKDVLIDPSSKRNYTEVRFGADAPLLEVELNEMQRIQNEMRAQYVRTQIPSGFLKKSPIDIFKWYPDENGEMLSRNAFFFSQSQEININGYLVNLPDYVHVKLDPPPVTGTREDLVIMEAWFSEIDATEDPAIIDSRINVETARRVRLHYHFRTIPGVDFEKFNIDGFTSDTYEADKWQYNNYAITPQADKASPVPPSEVWTKNSPLYRFSSSQQRQYYFYHPEKDPLSGRMAPIDPGLYVCGMDDNYYSHSGDPTYTNANARAVLGTNDGYVYAIPVFRIKRRNTSPYSVENSHGGGVCKQYDFVFTETPTYEKGYFDGQIIPFTLGTTNGASNTGVVPTVGDRVHLFNSYHDGYYRNEEETPVRYTVMSYEPASKTGTVRIETMGWGDNRYTVMSTRQDHLYGDIVHPKDIVDLRYSVSLTGFDNQTLLSDNFDKLMRGQLVSKSSMTTLKSYHGIPKTARDVNHVFYASMDGTRTAELGTMNAIGGAFVPAPTGLGVKFSGNSTGRVALSGGPFNALTVDVFMKTQHGVDYFGDQAIASFYDASDRLVFSLIHDGTVMGLYGFSDYPTNTKDAWTLFSSFYSYNTDWYAFKKNSGIQVRKPYDTQLFHHHRFVIAPTFAAGYIDGELAQKTNHANSKNVTTYLQAITRVAVGNSGNADSQGKVLWAPYTNKSVIMSDFAISKIDRGTTFSMVPKDVTDNNAVVMPAFYPQRPGYSDSARTYRVRSTAKAPGSVQSKDVIVTKKSGNTNLTQWQVGDTITITGTSDETISNTFTPVVQYWNGSAHVNVSVTNVGLGTNVWTITVNTALTTQDITIDYEKIANGSEGGGLPYVPNHIMGADYNGEKLVVDVRNDMYISADFRNKKTGSVTDNPHIMRLRAGTSSFPPLSTMLNDAEAAQSFYDDFKTIGDKKYIKSTATVSGQCGQSLLSYNLIAEIERQFGPIPRDSVASKVAWLRATITHIELATYGYVSSPSNIFNISNWDRVNSNWYANEHSYGGANADWYVVGSYSGVNSVITDDGFIHYLLRADTASASKTSDLYLHYAELEIFFNTGTYEHERKGYLFLRPQDTFYTGKKRNCFTIEKTTRLVKALMPVTEADSFTLYGEYPGYQGITQQHLEHYKATIIAKPDGLYVTTLGTGGEPPPGMGAYGGLLSQLPNTKSPHLFTAQAFTPSMSYGADKPAPVLIKVPIAGQVDNDPYWANQVALDMIVGAKLEMGGWNEWNDAYNYVADKAMGQFARRGWLSSIFKIIDKKQYERNLSNASFYGEWMFRHLNFHGSWDNLVKAPFPTAYATLYPLLMNVDGHLRLLVIVNDTSDLSLGIAFDFFDLEDRPLLRAPTREVF